MNIARNIFIITIVQIQFFNLLSIVEIPKSFIKQFLPKNPIILEAGTANGTDTLEMAQLWPEGIIYAFEPVPSLFEEMAERTQMCTNVIRFAYALSDKTGSAQFHVSGGIAPPFSSSLLKPQGHLSAFPGITFTKSIEVQTISLDDWAEQEGIDHIDFLWLDMQGVEPHVLMASEKILQTVKVVYTEVNYSYVYAGCILYPEFKKFMQSQGFTEIYEAPITCQGNVLFVRSDKQVETVFRDQAQIPS